MERACIQNLALIVTEDCNLDCRHCMRGKKCPRVMSKEVIESTLKQCLYIRNICLCSGEVLMHFEVLYHIIDCILKYKIIVDEISLTSNGTFYSLEFMDLLKSFRRHLKEGFTIAISYDEYHLEEIIKRNLLEAYKENILKYSESPYFIGLNTLNKKLKLFKEGNAVNLSDEETIALRPINYAMTYIGKNKHKLDLNGYCHIGPLISISLDGNITECDASFEHQKTKFNYGNVLTDSLVEVLKQKTPIYKPHIYSRKVQKIVYDFHHYNK